MNETDLPRIVSAPDAVPRPPSVKSAAGASSPASPSRVDEAPGQPFAPRWRDYFSEVLSGISLERGGTVPADGRWFDRRRARHSSSPSIRSSVPSASRTARARPRVNCPAVRHSPRGRDRQRRRTTRARGLRRDRVHRGARRTRRAPSRRRPGGLNSSAMRVFFAGRRRPGVADSRPALRRSPRYRQRDHRPRRGAASNASSTIAASAVRHSGDAEDALVAGLWNLFPPRAVGPGMGHRVRSQAHVRTSWMPYGHAARGECRSQLRRRFFSKA
jgi:hypothetical protein